MKTATWSVVFGLAVLGSAAGADPSRSRTLFDFDWRFALNDQPGAEQPGFDDSKWRQLDLPHDFSIEGPFVGSKEQQELAYNGFRPLLKGWYRKAFVTTPAMTGKRVVLEFEGVYQKASVYVNGTLVCTNLNGYLDFECDITKQLKPAGGTNVVAVLADNRPALHPHLERREEFPRATC